LLDNFEISPIPPEEIMRQEKGPDIGSCSFYNHTSIFSKNVIQLWIEEEGEKREKSIQVSSRLNF